MDIVVVAVVTGEAFGAAHANNDSKLAHEYYKKVLELGPEKTGQANFDYSRKMLDEMQAKPAAAEKRHVVEMDNVPWPKVMDWLNTLTGLPVQSKNGIPPGTFTFVAPKNQSFRIAEVIDLLNEALERQGYVLVRRDRSFLLLPVRKE